MQANLLPKIKQHIDEIYSTLVIIEQEKLSEMMRKIFDDIKAFIKQQQSAVSKDLAKKTKQLFVLSSDKESLTQKVTELQGKVKRLTEKVAEKQKHIIKLMSDKERQLREQQEKSSQTISGLKKQIQSIEIRIFEIQTKCKGEISDLRKIHKQEIVKAILREQQIAEANLQKQRQQFSEQKRSMIQTQNKEKSQLIKKYEHKLQDLRDNHEQQVFKLTTQHKQIQQKDKKIKADLNQDLFMSENNIKRLQGDLSRQTLSHNKFKTFSQTLSSQLQAFNLEYKTKTRQLQDKLQQTISNQTKNEKKLNAQIQGLKELLQNTIKEKDLLFNETVNMMKTDHNDELQSTKSMLIEEKQIAINQSEMKHYNETEKLNNKFYSLEKQHQALAQSYKTIAQQYQDKIAQIVSQYQSTISNIQKRNNYEINLEGQSTKKTLQVLQRKYKLEIKSLRKQYDQMKQELTIKINDQKLATTNKLTTQYQTMINDIKVNNDVTMKQKLIEFDRKSKAYQKKLSQSEKRRVDLKIQMDRQKLQLQIKIQSLSELVDKLQLQTEELHHHIIKLEKQKTTVINDYEFKLLVKKNQYQQLKDDFQIKQQELRNVFNQHIRVKNTQIQKFTQKVTLQVQNLIQKHNKRVEIIQKQYNQLKKIVSERTSLPQDIQALKIFHKAFVKLQQEIEKQKQMKRNLQRQLQSKAAIEKVFVSKTFVPKVSQPNPIKVVTMKQFYKKDQKLIKFKSQNL